jgi:predicted house-cleaning noncanonical NTP pyrophosphatase (MazG superfamily)/8-oxo-dGTP pyrophosphatase MutT (NUDIX family)
MSDMVDTFRMAAKAFIENEEGEILVLRESGEYEEGAHGEEWQIPGGRIEPGERYDEALRREVEEETGLEIDIGDPITMGEWRHDIKGEKFQIVAVFFHCKKTGGEVELSHEHSGFKWIDPVNPPDLNFIGNVPGKIEKFAEKSDPEVPKLVRDKIPEIIEEDDKEAVTREISDEKAKEFLREKVVEEAREFREEGEIEEFADLYAVMGRYMELEDISEQELEELEREKSSERGGFSENIVLEDIDD